METTIESHLDQDLLVLLKQSNHDAFKVSFERYWQRLFQSACARLNDTAIAQDIVQEIFIKIWQRRATLDIRSLLENYLQSALWLSVISYLTEGGAKLLLGPSTSVAPANAHLSFSVSGGPVFYVTQSAAFQSGAVRDIGSSASQNGYMVRAIVAFNLIK